MMNYTLLVVPKYKTNTLINIFIMLLMASKSLGEVELKRDGWGKN